MSTINTTGLSMYAQPFMFDIASGTPLLVMSCSQEKAQVGDALTRIADLYCGPTWQQVRKAGYPLTNVAAISALHGFCEPGYQIRTYDRKMDEDISARMCRESNHVWRLAQAIRAAGSAFVVGGRLYRAMVETAIRIEPDLAQLVTFATGTYLQQRKQLGEWLRANPRTADRAYPSAGRGPVEVAPSGLRKPRPGACPREVSMSG